MTLRTGQYRFLLLILSLSAFIITFRFSALPIEPGLDASWKYAHNRFFADDVRPGRDVIGTYGPLGFLVNTMPVGSNLKIACGFEAAVRLSLVILFVFLFLGDRQRTPSERVLPGLMLAILLLTVNRGEKTPGLELVVLTAGLVFTAERSGNRAFPAAAAVLTGLALLIKFSIGVLCLSFVGVYGLWVLVRQKRMVMPALWVGGALLSAAAIWLMLYGGLGGLGDYMVGSLEQSRGYSSAMTSLNAADAPAWIGAGIAVLLVLPFTIRRERDLLFLFLLLLPGLFISIKYGVTKQPQFLFHYSLFTLLFLAGQAKTLRRQAALAGMMSLFLLFLNMNTGFLGADALRFDTAEPVIKPPEFRTSFRQLTDFNGYEKDLRSRSETLLLPARLSDQALAAIGSSTVDTYPWEISFIPANNLNWRPRPVFQSYFTYTPWLDRRNEAFFLSDRAPAFLLWDIDRADVLQSIDGRYLLNDEPLTIVRILGDYAYAGVDRNAVVFRRRSTPALSQPVVFSSAGPYSWDEGFEVPFRNEGIVRARLRYNRTFLGRLRRTLYKDSPVFVDYLFDSGEMVHCRLVLDNASSGVWANPFVTSLLRPSSAARVVGMRIVNPDAAKGSFEPRFMIEWELVPFRSAPAPFFLTQHAP